MRRRRLALAPASARRGPGRGGRAGEVGGHGFIGQVLQGLIQGLRGLVDEAKQRLGSGVAVLVAVNEGRASVVVGVEWRICWGSAMPSRS